MADHPKAHKAVGAKIRKLKREGKSQKQAVGQALGMERHARVKRAKARRRG